MAMQRGSWHAGGSSPQEAAGHSFVLYPARETVRLGYAAFGSDFVFETFFYAFSGLMWIYITPHWTPFVEFSSILPASSQIMTWSLLIN